MPRYSAQDIEWIRAYNYALGATLTPDGLVNHELAGMFADWWVKQYDKQPIPAGNIVNAFGWYQAYGQHVDRGYVR